MAGIAAGAALEESGAGAAMEGGGAGAATKGFAPGRPQSNPFSKLNSPQNGPEQKQGGPAQKPELGSENTLQGAVTNAAQEVVSKLGQALKSSMKPSPANSLVHAKNDEDKDKKADEKPTVPGPGKGLLTSSKDVMQAANGFFQNFANGLVDQANKQLGVGIAQGIENVVNKVNNTKLGG